MSAHYQQGVFTVTTRDGPRRCSTHVEAGAFLPLRRSDVPAVTRHDWRAIDLFARFDLSTPPDQGNHASAAGFAAAYAYELLRRREGLPPIHEPDGAFVYALVNGGADLGCTLEAAVEAVVERGVPPTPAEPTIHFNRLPAAASAAAADRRVAGGTALACLGFDEIVTALHADMPGVLAFPIGPGFARTKGDGVPPQTAETAGFMAGVAGGLVRLGPAWALKVMLSWGVGFGDRGFVYLTETACRRPAGAYALTTRRAVDRYAPAKMTAPTSATPETEADTKTVSEAVTEEVASELVEEGRLRAEPPAAAVELGARVDAVQAAAGTPAAPPKAGGDGSRKVRHETGRKSPPANMEGKS